MFIVSCIDVQTLSNWHVVLLQFFQAYACVLVSPTMLHIPFATTLEPPLVKESLVLQDY